MRDFVLFMLGFIVGCVFTASFFIVKRLDDEIKESEKED